MKTKRIYLYLLLATAAGYGWLLWAMLFDSGHGSVCPMKAVTGLPCPSCGATRSVMSLAHGDFAAAWSWNPLGYILGLLLLTLPVWLAADAWTGRKSLASAYVFLERRLRLRWVAVPVVLLLICNWIWNIQKGI